MHRLTVPAQRGFALIDSLVALLVLGLGLLVLAQCMARQLAEIRATQARHIALQYIDAASQHLALGQAAGAAGLVVDPVELPPDWLSSLQAALPGALAQVRRTTAMPPQIAFVIAWPANERAMDTEDSRRQQALMQRPLAGSGFECPEGHLCHIAYARP